MKPNKAQQPPNKVDPSLPFSRKIPMHTCGPSANSVTRDQTRSFRSNLHGCQLCDTQPAKEANLTQCLLEPRLDVDGRLE